MWTQRQCLNGPAKQCPKRCASLIAYLFLSSVLYVNVDRRSQSQHFNCLRFKLCGVAKNVTTISRSHGKKALIPGSSKVAEPTGQVQ